MWLYNERTCVSVVWCIFFVAAWKACSAPIWATQHWKNQFNWLKNDEYSTQNAYLRICTLTKEIKSEKGTKRYIAWNWTVYFNLISDFCCCCCSMDIINILVKCVLVTMVLERYLIPSRTWVCVCVCTMYVTNTVHSCYTFLHTHHYSRISNWIIASKPLLYL